MRWLIIPLLLGALLPRLNIAGVMAQSSGGQSLTTTPALLYSTLIAGDSSDEVKDVAVDAAGNIYVYGRTFSDVFMGYEIERKGYTDLFVVKFNPAGDQILYFTLLGGYDSESAMSLEVDAQGNVYGTAKVFDDTFPTKNALWPTPTTSSDSVLFKLDSKGEVVYSTYLPDTSQDSEQNLAVDAAGNAYVVATRWGVVENEEFYFGQVSLLKINPTGTQLLLDRHYGGTGKEYGTGIDVDSRGTIYLVGYTDSDVFPVTENALQSQCGDIIADPTTYCWQDAIILILSPAGDVTYASYHGGNSTDEGKSIAADGAGNFWITGETISGSFPLVNPLQDSCPLDGESSRCYMFRGFISLFTMDAGGDVSLGYSSYIGAKERNSTMAIFDADMDGDGNFYITGYTNGKQFPVKNAFQDLLAEGFCTTFSSTRYCYDAFVMKFQSDGILDYSSYLGGVFDEYPYGMAVDSEGNLFVGGMTESADFPLTENGYQTGYQPGDNGFLVKIGPAATAPTATPTSTPTGSVTPSTTPATATPSVTPSTTPSVTPSTTPSVTPTVTTTPGTPEPTPIANYYLLLPNVTR